MYKLFLVVATVFAVGAGSANAEQRHHYGPYYHYYYPPRPSVVGPLVGGVIVGGVIGSLASRPSPSPVFHCRDYVVGYDAWDQPVLRTFCE
jgi:hypothetical protein